MKVLLCSPYVQTSDVVSGGINMWAHNILSYRATIETDVEIVPVSFDRKNYVGGGTSIIRRMYLGLKEFYFAVRKAKEELGNCRYDVIHICTSASISLTKDIVLLRAARKRGVKSVIHFHFGRIPELVLKNNWEWKLVKKCLAIATTAVVMDMKTYLTLRGAGYRNVVYCPNPLSMDTMNQIESEIGMHKRILGRLLFVGHVVPSKGVFELVEACRDLINIELHIVGRVEPDVMSSLNAVAREKERGRWLKFRGEIPHEEVLREMMKASIFVFPSYTEGFPNVILEAMACGCPIVTTSVGAIPEMLDMENGFNYGVCVAPKSVTLLHDAVGNLMSDEKQMSRLSKNAIRRVNEMYAMPKVWEQLVEIWK